MYFTKYSEVVYKKGGEGGGEITSKDLAMNIDARVTAINRLHQHIFYNFNVIELVNKMFNCLS